MKMETRRPTKLADLFKLSAINPTKDLRANTQLTAKNRISITAGEQAPMPRLS
jgi:hypothetical protein